MARLSAAERHVGRLNQGETRMATEAEELDVISAAWIMASNDETSLIAYEGIRHRLGLAADVDVRALIRRRDPLS